MSRSKGDHILDNLREIGLSNDEIKQVASDVYAISSELVVQFSEEREITFTIPLRIPGKKKFDVNKYLSIKGMVFMQDKQMYFSLIEAKSLTLDEYLDLMNECDIKINTCKSTDNGEQN